MDVYRWNYLPVPLDDSTARLWDWKDPQFLRGLRPPKRRLVVANAGFESYSLSPWMPFGPIAASLTKRKSHHGNSSLEMTSGNGSVYLDVNGINAGSINKVSVWVSASPGSTAMAMLAIYDPSRNTSEYSPTVAPGASWLKLEYSFVAHSSGPVRIHLWRMPGAGSLFWDDIEVAQES